MRLPLKTTIAARFGTLTSNRPAGSTPAASTARAIVKLYVGHRQGHVVLFSIVEREADAVIVSNIEPYASRFARALRTERRRQMTVNQQPPDFESKLEEFVVLPLNIDSERDPYPSTHVLAANSGLRQSFAINYSNMLECLLDLYFINLFQETEAKPAANRTLSYLSNVGTKIPGLSKLAPSQPSP